MAVLTQEAGIYTNMPKNNGIIEPLIRKEVMFTDFDDTMFFTGNAIRRASKDITGKEMLRSDVRKLEGDKKGKIYDLAITKYSNLMQENKTITQIMEAASTCMRVEILTANPDLEEIRESMKKLLFRYNVFYDCLIQRHESYASASDQVWKMAYVNQEMRTYSKGYVYDDRLENLLYMKERIRQVEIEYIHVMTNRISPL